MTVNQLLNWVSLAYETYENSYRSDTRVYNLCKKQSLLQTQPKKETHGYGANTGELSVAVNMIYACSWNEIMDMEGDSYSYDDPTPSIPQPDFPNQVSVGETVDLSSPDLVLSPTPMFTDLEIRQMIETANQAAIESEIDEAVQSAHRALHERVAGEQSTACREELI